MSLYNINTIQKNIDLLNTSYTDEYLLQSLANLGQRFAVKGDSIDTKTFNFCDLFINNYDPNIYIGKIDKKYDNTITFSVVDRSKINSTPVESISLPNTTKTIELSESITIDDYNYSNVKIKSSNYHYNVILTGSNSTGSEICIYDFNKYSNVIDEEIRINIYNDSRLVPLLYHIKYDKLLNKYNLNIYSYYNSDINLNNLIRSIYNIIDVYSDDFCVKNVLSKITTGHNVLFNELNNYKNISIDYNDKIFGLSDKKISEIAGNSLILSILKDDIEKFNKDILQIYPAIKKYFSNSLYFKTNNDLYKQLLLELYNIIIAYAVNSDNIVYIPINYSLSYYCNSNDNYTIYGGVDDILVKYIHKKITNASIDDFYDQSCFIIYSNLVSRNILFNFSVEYDNVNDNEENKNIYGINVYKKYIMPYINLNNIWVVNEVETEISAKGINAGNPNIVIIYNKTLSINNGFEILAGANKTMLNSLNWKLKQTYISPINNYDKTTGNILTISDLDVAYCWMPNIEEIEESKLDEYIEQLKYMFIISISSNGCLEVNNSISEKIYKTNAIFTTFWSYNELKREFEVLKHNENTFNNISPALDLVTLSNVNNITEYQVNNMSLKKPDCYPHNWLVFNKSYIITKNEPLINTKNLYATIGNYTGADISQNKYTFDNDLNFVIKYVNEIEGADDNEIASINKLPQNYKYLIFEENKIKTTNALYTYNSTNTSGNTLNNYLEFVPNINVPLFNTKEVLLQNTNVLNRLNILSLDNFDEYGYFYNGYIGTSFNDPDKFKFRIGTSAVNINIGTDTLIDPKYTGTNNITYSCFRKHTELYLDFNSTYVSGVMNCAYNTNLNDLYISGKEIQKYKPVKELNTSTKSFNRYEINNLNITPVSKYIMVDDGTINITKNVKEYDPLSYLSPLQLNNDNSVTDVNTIIDTQLSHYYNFGAYLGDYKFENESDIKLWTPLFHVLSLNNLYITKTLNYSVDNNNGSSFNKNTHGLFYIGDGLFIPSLLKRLKLENWCPNKDGLPLIEIKSNLNIIYYNSYPLLLVTNNRFLKDINYGISIFDNTNTIKNNNMTDGNLNSIYYTIPNDVLVGNNLSITYFISSDNSSKLNITINEANTESSILLPFKLNYIYPIRK